MWAVVVTVDIGEEVESKEATERLDREVVPAAKAMPGFKGGVWIRHEGRRTGMGIVWFESEQAAREMSGSVIEGGDAGGGATIRGVQVYEVLTSA